MHLKILALNKGYQFHTLANGIRIVHRQVPGQVAHLGVIIKSGSRDELEKEWGVAHFIEHMVFKGTKTRKAFHVLARMENVGGDLNAYTTKEETLFYASFLKTYYSRSAELLWDIIFNSVFNPKDMELEREVIIEEIKSYKDNPAELAFDVFEDVLYEGHALGRNILGSVASLKSLKRDDIFNFIHRTYNSDQIVISSVGNISMQRLVKILESTFGQVEASSRSFEREKYHNYKARNHKIKSSIYQTNVVMGNIAYDMNDKKKDAFSLVNNLLGGPGMNTRLNISIREKNGYAYAVESTYQPLSDTGYFSVYFATDKNSVDKTMELSIKEFDKVKTQKLGTLQLSRAKKQFIGQLALQAESNNNDMIAVAKTYLYFDKVDSMIDVYKRIDSISAEEILEVSNEILIPDNFTIVSIGK